MKPKIDSKTPLPKAGRPELYPWKDMQVGDSFLVKHENAPSNIRSTAYQAGIRHGFKFITRTEKKGVRIWRIE